MVLLYTCLYLNMAKLYWQFLEIKIVYSYKQIIIKRSKYIEPVKKLLAYEVKNSKLVSQKMTILGRTDSEAFSGYQMVAA